MSQAGIIILYFFSQYFYLCKMHTSWPTMSVWCVLWYLEEYPQCSQVYFYTDTCLFLMSWSLYRHFERCWWLDSLENNIVDHTLFMHGGKCGYPVAFLWNTTFFFPDPRIMKNIAVLRLSDLWRPMKQLSGGIFRFQTPHLSNRFWIHIKNLKSF